MRKLLGIREVMLVNPLVLHTGDGARSPSVDSCAQIWAALRPTGRTGFFFGRSSVVLDVVYVAAIVAVFVLAAVIAKGVEKL